MCKEVLGSKTESKTLANLHSRQESFGNASFSLVGVKCEKICVPPSSSARSQQLECLRKKSLTRAIQLVYELHSYVLHGGGGGVEEEGAGGHWQSWTAFVLLFSSSI